MIANPISASARDSAMRAGREGFGADAGSVCLCGRNRHQNQPEITTIAIPAPTIAWNARWTTVAGGSSSSGISSKPGTTPSGELVDTIDPNNGISMPNRTSPST